MSMAAAAVFLQISSGIRISDGKPPEATTVIRPPPPPPLNPKPLPARKPPSLPAAIFTAFDDAINIFIDRPLKPTRDPRRNLSGNFSPVDELPPTECQMVEGSLPPSLDGAYIRNGPNPQFLPRGPYHLFEGDGMLHSIRISEGKATFCSRYVRTYRYQIENEKGSSIIPNMFSSFDGLLPSAARGAVVAARVLTGQFDPAQGIGTANTSLAMIAGKLYALGESDLPYSMKVDADGEIHTLGRHDFNGKLVGSMCAHPKTDPETSETFAFRYGQTRPFLTFFRFNADGQKQPDVPIKSVTTPGLFHDLGITKTYAVFSDTQIGVNPMAVVVGKSPVAVNHGKVSRIGVIPRYAKDESEIRWFPVSGFNALHVTNTWDEDEDEEDGTIVMVAPNLLPVEHALERMDLIHSSIEKLKIDLKTGVVSRYPLSARNLDLAVINPAFVGRKNKYVYAAVGDPWPKVSGVVKLDISVSDTDRRDCVVAIRFFGPGCYGSEPFFVARQPDNPNADEDDGYLLNYVHNESTGESRFLVMDAKSPNLDVVAAVRLPGRVPYGFHGLFVRENDCNKK